MSQPKSQVRLATEPSNSTAAEAGRSAIGECLLHVSTFATTRVALPTEIEPRLIT
jgi:hypothetical protein